MKLLMENWRRFITEVHAGDKEDGEYQNSVKKSFGKTVEALTPEEEEQENELAAKLAAIKDDLETSGPRADFDDSKPLHPMIPLELDDDEYEDDEMEMGLEEGDGLWANIAAKKKRIKAGSGEKKAKPGDEDYPETLDIEEELDEKVDKDSMPCNKPRRTSSHKGKSHVVKACEDGKEKIIPFGEKGAKTAGKPKKGESEKMKKKRKSFKARHAKNIKKGKMSAAYWADKEKW